MFQNRSLNLLNAIRFLSIGGAVLMPLITGCSSLEPTPMQPSYPAWNGDRDVSREVDSACRRHAYQAAEQVKQQNVNTEVAGTLIGVIAGAVIGEALSDHGHYRGHPSWHHDHGRPGYHSDSDLTGTGAVLGGVTGAALSGGSRQDIQQVYDMAYDNCIESNLDW